MSLSPRNLILLGLGAILLIAIPLTVFVVQQQQQTESNANPATRLSFNPPKQEVALGSTVSLDVVIDPGQGANANLVGEMQLTITYNATKLELTDTKFSPDQNKFPISTEPEYSSAVDGLATISAQLSAGACGNVNCEINGETTIATIKFRTLELTAGTPAKVYFDPKLTIVRSADENSEYRENVLSFTGEAFITVVGGAAATPVPTATIAPTAVPTTTPAPPTQAPTGTANQIPACSGITLDKATAGTAPYTITFTAAGSDSDGTISNVTFSFGDGTVQDITEGGGIGTNAVSTQLAHTYATAGTFNATVTMTDEAGGVSDSATCTQTITVSDVSGGGGGGGGTGGGAVPTEPPAAISTPIPTLEPTGPAETLMGIGFVGIIFAIIGASILFIL
ncbi:MAG: PKD domain-containing protein [Patescibacteria group bacterium]